LPSDRIRSLLRDPSATLSPAAGGATGWVARLERFALPLVWALLILGFSLAMPETFPHLGNIAAILGSQVIVLLLSLALLIPLLAGDYDLSVSNNMALSAMILAVLNVQHHWPWVAAAGVATGAGLLAGSLNGTLTIVFGIDSLIVTLGIGTLLSGIDALISGSAVITGVSAQLVSLVTTDHFLGVPLEFWYGIVVCVLIWYFLAFTPAGRRLLFVGRNRTVARLSGIRVSRVRILSFLAAGLIAALCGIVFAGTLDGADPSSGPTYLLPAFAAVFLGATTITPGRFNPWGAFIAVYFLGTGISGLQLLGLASWIQPVFYGGALVVAVAFSQVMRGRQALHTEG
jgi:ribose transport system permease protein